MYQRCSRCVMDNAIDKRIVFDADGKCSYCNDIEKRMPHEYFPENSNKLDAIIKQIKNECVNDQFDCMVGISGGIDSSYILYLGYRFGLRMIAVHIDDGLDNPIATENIKKLIQMTGTEYISITPNKEEYADIIYSLLKASVSNLAIAQDNLIIKALQDYGEKNNIRYILDGSNFAHESILERSEKGVNSSDKKFIMEVHKRFGRMPIKDLEFTSIYERYIRRHRKKDFKHVRILNYIDYNLESALKELKDFCGFEYYGGKHYESILTRFMQCYYLPEKFGLDKRKSHYSSLIMSGQMSREDAINKLKAPLYTSEKLLNEDMEYLAKYMGITIEEFKDFISQPPKGENDYPHSKLNELAPIARKFRRILE